MSLDDLAKLFASGLVQFLPGAAAVYIIYQLIQIAARIYRTWNRRIESNSYKGPYNRHYKGVIVPPIEIKSDADLERTRHAIEAKIQDATITMQTLGQKILEQRALIEKLEADLASERAKRSEANQ